MFLQVFPFLAILHAAFTSLFLGTEYQDGTLRNKLIAGHPRWKVYGAYLITAAAGCFVIVAGWLAGCAVGAMRFGWFTMPAQTMLLVLEAQKENCVIYSMRERDESLESFYMNLIGGVRHA